MTTTLLLMKTFNNQIRNLGWSIHTTFHLTCPLSMEYFVEGIRSITALDQMNLINLTLKSLSPLFFSIFDKKLSHPWIQIKKKKIEIFTSFHGF